MKNQKRKEIKRKQEDNTEKRERKVEIWQGSERKENIQTKMLKRKENLEKTGRYR